MHKLYEDLKRSCKILSKELTKAVDKLEANGSVISAGDLDYFDKLIHAVKSALTAKAMLGSESEHDEDDEKDVMAELKSLLSRMESM